MDQRNHILPAKYRHEYLLKGIEHKPSDQPNPSSWIEAIQIKEKNLLKREKHNRGTPCDILGSSTFNKGIITSTETVKMIHCQLIN